MHHPRGSAPRSFALCLVALLLPAAAWSSGTAEQTGGGVPAPAAPVRLFDVQWFNASAAALVPAENDPVAQAIERRFGVTLTLLGGPWGSGGYRRLADDIENNSKIGPNDARRKALPDLFPWAAGLGGTPALPDLFVPLPLGLIRKTMPRTWTDIQIIAQKSGLDPAAVWAPFVSDGVPYAIPQVNTGWMFPAGVLWRADVLERLGRAVPSTIEEWEGVFRAYRQAYPTRVPWTDVGDPLPFLPLFEATGRELSGFVVKEGRLQSGLVQPEMRTALLTLRRWYTSRYVAIAEYGSSFNSTDANGLFVSGRNIVTPYARPEDGSWICSAPYVAGSLQDLTSRRVPGAAFAMGPRPVFAGTSKAAGSGRAPPFGVLCFGFSKALAGQPEKLQRIMGMVDTLAADDRMYLTAMYGIEGSQWTWQRTGSGRYPVRLPSPAPVNTGRYWIFPWSAHDAEYSLTPRILDSIGRLYGNAASLYGAESPAGAGRTGAGSAGAARFSIPYADSGAQAQVERDRYRALSSAVWARFFEYVLSPMVYYGAGAGVFDDFVRWYRDNGGDELERIVSRWAGR